MDQNYSAYSAPTGDIFTEEVLAYGGFWERFAAIFIDGLVLCIPNFLFTYFTAPGYSTIWTLLVSWLYNAVMMSGPNQATLGKKAMGLKVISEDREPVSFAQATGRYFSTFVSSIILGIGYFMMLWDPKKQTLHDKMASTLVVKG